jgi:integrase
VRYEDLCRVEPSHVRLWCAALREEGLAGGTIGVWLAGCAGFFALIHERGDIRLNPFKGPSIALSRGARAPRNPIRDMGKDNASKLLKVAREAGPRDYALMCCLLGGGLRLSEVLGLCSDNILERDGVTILQLIDNKSGAPQEQSLPAWAAIGLKAWACQQAAGWPVFNIKRRTAHDWFKRMQVRARIFGNYSVHSCRVTAINELIRQGIPLRDIRAFSRHKSVVTVERYERRVRDALDNPAINALLF